MRGATRAWVGVGSNVGDREAAIRSAAESLDRSTGIAVRAMSALRETAPVGVPGQRRYVNAVVEIETCLEPHRLLARCLAIEAAHGRDRRVEERWGPRPLDLDVLLYGDAIIAERDLTVPHPRMHERLFVLVPMAELAPAQLHPVLGRTMESLCESHRRVVGGQDGEEIPCSGEPDPGNGRTAQRTESPQCPEKPGG